MPIEHDVTEAAGVAAGVVSDEVVEAVVSDAAAGGVDLLGPDGVLAELTKRILERALAEEMTDHLGYESGDPIGHGTGNNRNGTSPKQVLTEIGAVDLDIPRDRNATFEPRIVPKGARRLERFNSNIVALYARGLSTRDIRLELKRMYGVDVSPALVSKVTDGILEELTDWQNRPLDGCYPMLYIDAMVVKVRTSGTVINRPAYVVVGVDVDGRKHVLGVWLGDGGEGAKYWLSVLTEIRNRGLEDALIVCCDGLRGHSRRDRGHMAPGAGADLCHTPAASLYAPLQLERPKNHCGGLATCLHRGKRRSGCCGVGRARGTMGKSLSRRDTNMAPGVGRVHPVPTVPARASQNRVHNQRRRKRPLSTTESHQNQGAFPHRPISSKAAAARRPKHHQQTRRKPRHRHPRLENSPKPTRNPLPQPTKPNPIKTHEPTPSHRRFDRPPQTANCAAVSVRPTPPTPKPRHGLS